MLTAMMWRYIPAPMTPTARRAQDLTTSPRPLQTCPRAGAYPPNRDATTTPTGSNAFVVADDGTTLGYTVSGLQPQNVYAYSVQARLGDRLSIVSDTIGVDTTGVIDAIRALPFAANDVAIYDLQGRLVTTLPNVTNAAAVLPKGIYIAGGRKFVVK